MLVSVGILAVSPVMRVKRAPPQALAEEVA